MVQLNNRKEMLVCLYVSIPNFCYVKPPNSPGHNWNRNTLWPSQVLFSQLSNDMKVFTIRRNDSENCQEL